MFTSREELETGGGTASLGLRLADRGALRTPPPSLPRQHWPDRFERLRRHWNARVAQADWTVDLAE